MRELLSSLNELYNEIRGYVNAVGDFYLKYQLREMDIGIMIIPVLFLLIDTIIIWLFFRVLFVNLILSDVFSLPRLVCDTQQIGCLDMCINRFAPITFKLRGIPEKSK